MSRSRSRSSSSTSSAQTSNVQNLNLQEIDGTAIAGVDGDVTITSTVTDQGAIDAARDIAISSIDAGAVGFSDAIDFASDVVAGSQRQNEIIAGTALSVTQEGFDFGAAVVDDAVLTIENSQREVLDFARDAQSGVFDLVRDTNAGSRQFAEDLSGRFVEGVDDLAGDFVNLGASLIQNTQDFIGQAGSQVIGAVNDIQRRESVNTDARLEEITRIALIGAGVVAAIAIATQLRK